MESNIQNENSTNNYFPLISFEDIDSQNDKTNNNSFHNTSNGNSEYKEDLIDYQYVQDGFPKHLNRYWHQRYSLFSKFDDGIIMDEEGWYSVTPEKIAEHIAKRCAGKVVIDAFCGCGGNAIQFAKYCQKVIAIDIDPLKLSCAKKNAQIYGVANKIQFIEDDCLEFMKNLSRSDLSCGRVDIVFLSPPWGGPDYLKAQVFDLECMPIPGSEIFKVAASLTNSICYFLPRNSDMDQLKKLTKMNGKPRKLEIEQQFLNERLKCISCYYGEF